MSKHTKGTWKVDSNCNIVAVNDKGMTEVAKVDYHSMSPKWQKENKANARLISASPDLLGAVKSAYAELAQWLDNPAANEKTGKVLDQLAAAIAKAEGQ